MTTSPLGRIGSRGARRAMRAAQQVRAAVAGSVSRSSSAVDVLEAVGAHTLADRLDRRRSGGEIVSVRVPPGIHHLRSRRVKALRRHGRDQCVEAFHQAGWWGYERPLPDVLLATLRHAPGPFFDVGANTGVYSLIATTVRGVDVHAFEAYPPVADLLRENLALNRSGRRVHFVEAAASDVVGEIQFFVPQESGPIETSSSTEAGFREGSVPITVSATTLDAYWESIGSPAVAAVKLDVEGAEHRVLAGARRLVAAARPVVFYEVLPDARLDELEDFRAGLDLVDVRLSQWEAVVNDRIKFHELAWNHALVPAERLEEFLEPLPRLGLQITRLATPSA